MTGADSRLAGYRLLIIITYNFLKIQESTLKTVKKPDSQ